MKLTERHCSKLLVEGNDDQHVVMALCAHHHVVENFDIIDCGSVDNVLKQLEIRLSIPLTNRHIGVVVDADVDLENRWRQIREILNKSGKYTVPEHLSINGLILSPNDDYNPIVGVWIMPDNNLNGMLEDFVAFLASGNDALMVQAEKTLLEIEAHQIHRYKKIHRAKAKVHSFLAWQEDPGTPMGLAITKKYLEADCDTAQLFVNWLKNLYKPNA